jgi:phosphoribosylformylglycinamidine synthase
MEACRQAGAEVEAVHLNQLLHGARALDDFSMLIVPGGFSFGDHLGAGTMLATVLRHHLLDQLDRFVASGRPVLGICNGFQVLARLGMLGDISLVANTSGDFQCGWVELDVLPSPSIFLQGLEDLELPIAHGQGRVVIPEQRQAELLQLAPLRYRHNPNGSVASVAGVCNRAGNVLGLMPHPERFVHARQHPAWTRGAGREPAGLKLFRNAVCAVERL